MSLNAPKALITLFLVFATQTAYSATVVEYYNPDLDNYFITADPGEQTFIDGGSVGNWQRTGNTFPTGGPSQVCRFYGSAVGPNSHFYTADAEECAFLKSIYNPAAKSWKFESNDFNITKASNGVCPSDLFPVYRAYNNGSARGVDSNHRITNNLASIQEVASRGWNNEGIVMCSPQIGTTTTCPTPQVVQNGACAATCTAPLVAKNGFCVTPPPLASTETSYKNFKEIGLVPQTLPSPHTARAYGDFSRSGQLDMFTASITYWPPTTPAAATPSKFEFWRKQKNGKFLKDTGMLASPIGCIHPRKALVADFNGDEHPDIFVACHGFDAAPYPGEHNKVVLSQPGGTYVTQDASEDIGFFHSASAADLNDDGLPDVVVVSFKDQASAFVLLNQGKGVFKRESSARLPSSIGNRAYFTVELVDVDDDGKLDVVLGGDEAGAPTVVLLNPGTSDFTSVIPITVPPVPGESVVLDIAVTGTGSTRALWLLRTSPIYQSRAIQKVLWPSLSSTVPLHNRPAQWIPWIIPTIVNGQNSISSDNISDHVTIPQ